MENKLHILGNERDIWYCLEKCSIEFGVVCYCPKVIAERHICFMPRIEVSFVFNSFAPVVDCALHDNVSFIELILSFSLKKSIRIIAEIYVVISALLEGLFVYWHYSRGLLGVALAAPILLLLYFACFIGVGVKIESSRFVKALLIALNENGFQEA